MMNQLGIIALHGLFASQRIPSGLSLQFMARQNLIADSNGRFQLGVLFGAAKHTFSLVLSR